MVELMTVAPTPIRLPEIEWFDKYARAMTAAEDQNKMMLVYFCDDRPDGPCHRFTAETLADPTVRRKLMDYVCVQVPLDGKITVDGEPVTLLQHDAFHEMLGRPGIAIVDFRSTDAKLRGAVVSTFPITGKLWYTPERMAVILDLPPATLTQRTLIYAVRIHPEKPASTSSELDPDLLQEAQSHSEYQARIRLQGHHFWESRFHRIVSRLPGGLRPRGVRRELAGRKPGRGGHRVRPLLAALRRALERRSGSQPLFRLRHETRQQWRLVCHRHFCDEVVSDAAILQPC